MQRRRGMGVVLFGSLSLPAIVLWTTPSRWTQQAMVGSTANPSTYIPTLSQSSTTITKQQVKEQSPYEVSLWLLPPEGEIYNAWQDEIIRLAHLHKDSAGISFSPHVTLVGGVKVQRPQQINELIETLQTGLRGMGPIRCKFQSTNLLSFATNAETGAPVWNQAAVARVVPTLPFLRLCRNARKLMGLADNENACLFAPPLLQPHLSLYYGRTGVPTADEIHLPSPSDFVSDRVALWKTFPSYNETTVPSWSELAIISLGSH